MYRILFLLVLTACATKIKHTEPRHVKYVEPSDSVPFWKGNLTAEDKKQFIDIYWNFYAYSLRDKCPNLKYQRSFPGNQTLNLPGIEFGELKPGKASDKNVIQGGTFDLSTELDNQRYKFFQIQTEELEKKEHLSDDGFRIVLMRTGKAGQIRYVACNDKAGQPVICTEDSLISKIVNVNDTEKLCQTVMRRKYSPMPQDKFLDGVLGIMQRLQIK
jgi:hypothetical protein